MAGRSERERVREQFGAAPSTLHHVENLLAERENAVARDEAQRVADIDVELGRFGYDAPARAEAAAAARRAAAETRAAPAPAPAPPGEPDAPAPPGEPDAPAREAGPEPRRQAPRGRRTTPREHT